MNKPAEKQTRKVIHGPIAQAQILDAVDELFYMEGARAVSVDAVAKYAGVNKMCIYRQFESKDELLLRYLERRNQYFWENFEATMAKHVGDPRQQLLQFFTDMAARTRWPGYRGCALVNIVNEFPDREHPARKLVTINRQKLLVRLQQVADQAGAADSQGLANGLALLLDGAFISTQTYPLNHPILTSLVQVVTTMVDAACLPARQSVLATTDAARQ
ncbi:MAG TPA: TetR/AcrR family transcriptional regulator [Methylophilaceae bacterium]|jgi:AcrR family transcriptional regulator